jgi:hypothetical protein
MLLGSAWLIPGRLRLSPYATRVYELEVTNGDLKFDLGRTTLAAPGRSPNRASPCCPVSCGVRRPLPSTSSPPWTLGDTLLDCLLVVRVDVVWVGKG